MEVSMPNTVEVRSAPASIAIVSLVGEHDLGEYEQLQVAFERAAVRGRNVLVDLSRCEFIDSTMIGVLLHAQSVVAADQGRFAIALPSEPNAVTRVAEMVHLGELAPIYASVEEALSSFAAPEASEVRAAG
jgi:anti-anti-sigma factor